MAVPALAIAALTGSWVDGSISEVTAETPKAIDPGEVEGGDPPRQRSRAQAEPALADRGVGELARDQEADRAEDVRRPYPQVGLAGVEAMLHAREGAHVEEQRAGELDDRRPPVDPAGV